MNLLQRLHTALIAGRRPDQGTGQLAGTASPTRDLYPETTGDPQIDEILLRNAPGATLYELGIPGMNGTLDPVAALLSPRARVTLTDAHGQATSRPVPEVYALGVAYGAVTDLHIDAVVDPVEYTPDPSVVWDAAYALARCAEDDPYAPNVWSRDPRFTAQTIADAARAADEQCVADYGTSQFGRLDEDGRTAWYRTALAHVGVSL